MLTRRSNILFLVICLFLIAVAPALAQPAKVERIGAVATSAVPPEVAAALEEKGYRVKLDDGWSAEFWCARELKVATNDAPNALYPRLANGEFIAVITLPKGMSDFRGQAIPAGTYTLRYQYIPQDANHMGVSPNPDFLLAIPVAADPSPPATIPFKKLVALSSKTTGAHPAVIAMETPAEPGQAAFSEKLLVFTVPMKSSGGDLQKIGVVLKGQAAQ